MNRFKILSLLILIFSLSSNVVAMDPEPEQQKNRVSKEDPTFLEIMDGLIEIAEDMVNYCIKSTVVTCSKDIILDIDVETISRLIEEFSELANKANPEEYAKIHTIRKAHDSSLGKLFVHAPKQGTEAVRETYQEMLTGLKGLRIDYIHEVTR